MKITFMLTWGDAMGGTERAIYTQAEYLARRHEVEILSVFRTSTDSFFQIDPRIKVRHLVDNTGGVPRPVRASQLDEATCRALATSHSKLINARWEAAFNRLADIEMERALRELDCDVLVSTSPALMAVTTTLAPPHVVTVHQEHRPSQLRGGTGEPLFQFAPRLDAMVVLTDRTRDWLAESMHHLAPRLEVIPNAIPAGYRPRSTRQTRVVTIAGRMVPDKQIDHAIRAFAPVAERHPDWLLRVLGDGPQLPVLRGLVDRFGIHDNVQFLGRTPHMAEEWSKSSIALLTSRDGEALPLVLLEAFAAGVPAISYDCQTGPAEIITHGVNGFVVGPGDVTELTERLLQLIEDENLRHDFGTAALRAAQAYDLDTVMSRWDALYTQLLSERDEGSRADRKADRLAAWVARTGGAGFAPAAPRPDRPVQHVDAVAAERRMQVGDAHLVKFAGRLSVVSDEMTPDEATVRNLRLVTDALERSGVDYWLIRHNQIRHRVAVQAEHRQAAIDALAAAYGDSPVYAETISASGGLSGVTLAVALPSYEPAATAGGLRVFRPVVTSSRTLRYAGTYGCDLEFWERSPDGRDLVPLRTTLIGNAIPTEVATPARLRVHDRDYPTIQPFRQTFVDDVTFPIDAVYTWVDGDDPAWLAKKNAVLSAAGRPPVTAAAGDARFRSRDELRYSLRSIAMFAPWINHIWLVTDEQVPSWLDTSHPKITVVDHKQIFGDRGKLPTFNSHAIESQLHHIDGLAEHFLYFNDDMFLGRPVQPTMFFQSNGAANFFLSPTPVPLTPVSDDDDFNFAAAKNNRRLIEAAFGQTITHGFLHAPYPLRVSVLSELEERFSAEVAATAASQFRSRTDISVPSSLHHYYGYFTGRSGRGSIRVSYVDLSDADQHPKLSQILASRSYDAFCLNDTHHGDVLPEESTRVANAFLQGYFPVASEFELGSVRNRSAVHR